MSSVTPPPSAMREPILVLDRVQARDAAAPRGKARGRLDNLSLALSGGVTAILGGPEDGTLALAEVIGGAKRPLRGALRVLGRDPAKVASIRARIGVLGAEPRLPPVATVADSVRLALRARGEDAAAIDALLDPLGLSPLHARRIRSLSFAEARAVELALALSTPAPMLVALYEPLADVAVSNVGVVRQRLRELANAGACVVVMTSSPADARALAERVLVLHRGTIARELAADGSGAELAGPAQIVVWMRAGSGGAASLRAVASTIVAFAGVNGVSWEAAPAETRSDGSASRSVDDPGIGVLRIHAVRAEAAARAVIDAVLDADVIVDAIAPATPSLAHVRAATEAMLRAMTVRRAPPAPPPPPPPASTLPLPPPALPSQYPPYEGT